MRITCDATDGMGYIYLMPPKQQYYNSNNHLHKYLEQKNVEIPMARNNEILRRLDRLKISNKTYKNAVYKYSDIHMEYCNDMDKDGYIIGIELNLRKEKFIELIANKAFRIFYGDWRGKVVSLLTLDLIDKVFSPDNIIYPLNSKRDAFIIVYMEPKYKVGLVKALITSRNDIYPIDYLKVPDFVISK